MATHRSHSSRDRHAGPLLDAVDALVLGLPAAAWLGYALLLIFTTAAILRLAL